MKKLVSLEASGLGLEKLEEEPREIVAAEGLAVGLAVSPDQGLHKLLAVNENEYFTELQLKEEVL
ncbi:Methyl-CpG-binding domain protein 1 [Apodemus speciosus]|uniref:Methyl-CpG-binding domain protein 1 n=1 Tax=Apodemus speciosus TaxID=105296 RepID=A0ABQ0FRJ5_APOSI